MFKKNVENSLSDNTVGRVMTLADKFKKEALYQTAVRLLRKNYDIHEIVELTGLSIEEIKELQDKE